MPRSEPFPNAPEPLSTPTYDGSGQCVHPDVLAVGGRFYGARYVMAVEPYAFGGSSTTAATAAAARRASA